MDLKKPKILVVDDAPLVLSSVTTILQEKGYDVTAVNGALGALEKLGEEQYDLILTDNQMPDMTGLELMARVNTLRLRTPVILMTAYADVKTSVEAIRQGVFDFVIKPFQVSYLVNTIKKAVEYSRLVEVERSCHAQMGNPVQANASELLVMSREIIVSMANAAEFRNLDMGAHVLRVGIYSARIAAAMGLHEAFVEDLRWASSLHDIGKIAIPDAILLKAGALTPEEFEKMKEHTILGSKLLIKSSQPLMRLAASVALNHHEKWNGAGYPHGLKGEQIPLEARIVLMADLYDSMRNTTSYKRGLTHEEVLRIMIEGDNLTRPEHFDPQVYRAFIRTASTFDAIYCSQVIPEDILSRTGIATEVAIARKIDSSRCVQLGSRELEKIGSIN